jgi:NADH-quinone oxidoreductase subunit N
MNAPRLDLAAIAPIAFTGMGALVVLLAEVWISRRASFLGRKVTDHLVGAWLAVLSVVFLGIAIYCAGAAFSEGATRIFDLDNPMLRLDRFAAYSTALIGVASFLVCWLSMAYLAELRINHGEYYALVLLSTAGMFLLVGASDLMALFLGLELMSIPLYVLAGFDRRNLRSNESAFKYFLVGSFASAVLLYGIALVYGVSGALDFDGIRQAFPPGNPLGTIGLALLVVGFAFKVASVPFHQWAPDVYEGAPTSVTAYMAITVKVAAFAALLRMLIQAFGPVTATLSDLFWGLAVLTVIVGNVMAVIQSNLKRLLAYSSIAHAGYLLIGFATGTIEGYGAVLFYLLVYTFMNLGAFAVLIALTQDGRDCDTFDDLAGLARQRPGLAALLTLFALSLAGIPGTAGFVAKFFLFKAAVTAGQTVLAIIGVLGSVVSVYYYLRLPVVMYMSETTGNSPAQRREASTGELFVLAFCAVVVLFLGFFPSSAPGIFGGVRALEWARASVAMLF